MVGRNLNPQTTKCECADAIKVLHNKTSDHETRIVALETIANSLDQIGESVEKILKYIKVAAPSIVSAALAAGLVNGKVGAFLAALLR